MLTHCPEIAIGVTEEALGRLLGGRFEVLHRVEGEFTGGRGPGGQETLVLRKR